MATNTAGTAARQLPFQAVHYLRCNLTETSALTGTIGILPAGAVILSAVSGVYVNVVFSGGNPTVDIGTASSTTLYASALDLDAALGYVALDEISGDTLRVTTDTTLVYTLVLDTPVAADGNASIVIAYVVDNDR
jgi:hypothetical protein